MAEELSRETEKGRESAVWERKKEKPSAAILNSIQKILLKEGEEFIGSKRR